MFNYEDEENVDIVDPRAYAYLLTWLNLIYKLNSPLQHKQYDLLKQSIVSYIDQNKFLYCDFLNVIFNWLDAIDIVEADYKKYLQASEISKIETEWSDFLSKESLFKLLVQSLYMFATKFPSYLR